MAREIKKGTFTEYIFSHAASWFWGISGITVFLLIVIFLLPLESSFLKITRAIAGGAYVMFFPGFSITRLLYPLKDIDNIHTTAYSIGISASLVPIVGIILNITPFGMSKIPVIITIVALNTLLSVSALYREFNVLRS